MVTADESHGATNDNRGAKPSKSSCWPCGSHTPRDAANLLLAALADSGFTPNRLVFDCAEFPCVLPILRPKTPRYLGICAAMSRISNLRFGFRGDNDYNYEPRLEGMRQLCGQAVQLRELELDCAFASDGELPGEDGLPLFDRVEPVFDACPLETVRIRGLLAPPSVLDQFLRKHKAHLRRLELIDCGFYNAVDFVSLHGWMIENLRLQHLGLREVWLTDDIAAEVGASITSASMAKNGRERWLFVCNRVSRKMGLADCCISRTSSDGCCAHACATLTQALQ